MAEQIRGITIDYNSLDEYMKYVIEQIPTLETGIHKVDTNGGPAYHVTLFKLSQEYYSAIISSYAGSLFYIQYYGGVPTIRVLL